MAAQHNRLTSSSTTESSSGPALKSASFFLLILISILATPELASAQGCCTASATSLRGLEGGAWNAGLLNIGVNYQYNSLTTTYNERARIDDPLRRTAAVSYFTLSAEYGLSKRVSIFGSVGFSDKSREITVRNSLTLFDETSTFRASGFGDMLLLFKYQLIPVSITSPFGMAIGAGASLPTGSFTKERNGVQLSIDLQPGTGAIGLLGWIHASHFFQYAGIQLSATATYKYSGVNLDGYRVGDELLTVLGGEYRAGENFGFHIQLRSRFAGLDYANRRVLTATGGTYHDVLPSIVYYDGPSFVRVFSQLPVYRNVKGIQLTLTYLLGVEYTYTLDLSGDD